MVGTIDIHAITLDELVGVVNLYPWYGAARVEMCRRMSAMGDWGEDQFSAEALYVADRSKLSSLLRGTQAKADYADKDVQALLAAYLEPAQSAAESGTEHQVHVVGGDYFSQAQYDDAARAQDNIFSRFAFKASKPEGEVEGETSDIADRFATETLARIFAEQGRTEEARRIYSRLVLDIPEKSAYFASLIDNLE